MELWTAFLLGLVGSAHCAGMCGPLVMALPVGKSGGGSSVLGPLIYNLGRIATYGLLGLLVGLVGQTFVLAGFQRWISLAAGFALLIGLTASSRSAWQTPAWKTVAWLKSAFARLLRQRTFTALLGLGAINGLLPCGLVYVAAAGAITSGSFLGSVEYMLAFGLGTLPMMFGMALAGKTLQFTVRLRLQKLIPISVALLAVLLILRGMSLGIPYLSPDLSGDPTKCALCP